MSDSCWYSSLWDDYLQVNLKTFFRKFRVFFSVIQDLHEDYTSKLFPCLVDSLSHITLLVVHILWWNNMCCQMVLCVLLSEYMIKAKCTAFVLWKLLFSVCLQYCVCGSDCQSDCWFMITGRPFWKKIYCLILHWDIQIFSYSFLYLTNQSM